MTDTIALSCRCGETAAPGERFCEACGRPLPWVSPGSDHEVVGGPTAAAVCDRGLVRRRNEDAVRLMSTATATIAVVCDGVSGSAHGDRAAHAAADAITASLQAQVDGGEPLDMGAAVAAGQGAVCAIGYDDTSEDTPSTTALAAVWDGRRITVASVGDCRAYWVAPGQADLLTNDDSLNEGSHVITRWLGLDAPSDPVPVTVLEPDRRGHLVLCSDGLWNSLPDPADLASAAPFADPEADCTVLAAALLVKALEAGGRDNVTVAVIVTDPTEEA